MIMSMYRCAACGSSHVVVDTKKEGFSVGKAVVGTAVFGAGGAVMGVNGKEKLYYHCAACGQTLSYPMQDFKKNTIDKYLSDPSKYSYFLEDEKKNYPNIEWDNKNDVSVGIQPQSKPNNSINKLDRETEFDMIKEAVLRRVSGDKIVSIAGLTLEPPMGDYSMQRIAVHVKRMVGMDLLGEIRIENQTYYGLPETISKEKIKQEEELKRKQEEELKRKQRIEEAKAHNKKINEQIEILQVEKKEQEVIVAENKNKIFGAGAKAKKAALNRITEIDAEIGELNSKKKR